MIGAVIAAERAKKERERKRRVQLAGEGIPEAPKPPTVDEHYEQLLGTPLPPVKRAFIDLGTGCRRLVSD